MMPQNMKKLKKLPANANDMNAILDLESLSKPQKCWYLQDSTTEVLLQDIAVEQ
jgi:hypothetical protein